MEKKLKILLIIVVIIGLIMISDIGYSFAISGKAVMYPERHKITCIDSDADEDYPNGLNYLVKGYVQFGNKKTYDKCLSTTTLKEMYCRNTKIYDKPMPKRVSCKNGCLNGACLLPFCGDGTCQEEENALTCQKDCDKAPPTIILSLACPDGCCTVGETITIVCSAVDSVDPNPATALTLIIKPDGTSSTDLDGAFTDTTLVGAYTATCTASDSVGNTATGIAPFYVFAFCCGDRTCQGKEDCNTCPIDCTECQPAAYCGDASCNANEDCGNCQADCGECPTIEYQDFGCEYKSSIDVSDARHTGGTAEKGIDCYTPQEEGFEIQPESANGLNDNGQSNATSIKRTREFWIIYNGTEGIYDVYYYDKDNKNEYWFGYFDASATSSSLVKIKYWNTKEDNIILKTNSLTENALTLIFDINGKCIPDGSEDIEMLWGLNLQGDINSLGLIGGGTVAEKAELKVGTQEIGDLTQDYTTQYGVIIKDPSSQGSNDAVVLSIPNNQLPSCPIPTNATAGGGGARAPL